MLYMRSKLDLSLDTSELTSLVERYGMRTIQDVIPCLEGKNRKPFNKRDVLSTPASLSDLALDTRQNREHIASQRRTPGSDLHIKQIELDWISGVNVLVRVEELASEQKGLVLIHPLLSEGPAVVQPVH